MQADTLSLVTEILRGAVGSDVEITGSQIAAQRRDYVVLTLDLRCPEMRVSVKLAGPRAPYDYPFDRTAYFHRLVAAETAVPMPEILAVDVSYRTYPWRYLVKSYLPGEMWIDLLPRLSTEERVTAYGSIGEAVAALHDHTLSGFRSGGSGRPRQRKRRLFFGAAGAGSAHGR